MRGLDYSFARPPYPGWLIENGYFFVCRYLSWLPNGKVISKAEFDGLRAAGVLVVLNWEYDVDDFAGGASNGQRMASEAMRQAQVLGAWPCPIYFSKDQNTAPSAADTAFLTAAAGVLGGAGRVGLYGSTQMCAWARQRGLAKYTWQNVWGAGWDASNQIWQTVYEGALSWGGVDHNQTNAADFGQVGGQKVIPASAIADVTQQQMEIMT